jgi:hypothetical protein
MAQASLSPFPSHIVAAADQRADCAEKRNRVPARIAR